MLSRELFIGNDRFDLDETDAKRLAYALRLMYSTNGNADMVYDILCLENSAVSESQFFTIVKIAEKMYSGEDYTLTRWQDMPSKSASYVFPLV